MNNGFKLLIGLGLPYEDHLALEAIAQGSVFMNPKFSTHKNRLNDPTLKDLPSSRNLSSQHPYAEIFIGEPFVYTANIWNKTEVKISIKNILSKQVRKERLSLEVIIGLSTLFPLLYLLNTLLLQLTVFIQDQTICSFRVFL